MSTGRRERKKQEVRRRILDVATALFTDRGLSATTVDQIAETADISQTTFFNYFGSKAALVDALVERLIDLWQAVLDAHEADTPAANKIGLLFHGSAELTDGQHRLLRDLVTETVRAPLTGPSTSLGRMRRLITDELATGQRNGDVRTDMTPEVLAESVIGIYVSVFLFWIPAADRSLADRIRAAADIAAGLMSPRP